MRLIAGNWKANGTPAEATALCRALPPAPPGAQVVVCPPFTALEAAARALPAGVGLGAQDLFWEDGGAFTGQVTAPMLVAAGCSHVLVGHSERRRDLGETDAQVAAKLAAAWRHGLVPILCVGETAQQRDAGETAAVLRRQVTVALQGSRPAPLAVAYEPIWAIGTGRAAQPEDCRAGLTVVRAALHRTWGVGAPCLYGGSVNPANCAAFWLQGGADGALVGGASLDAGAFGAICRAAGGD